MQNYNYVNLLNPGRSSDQERRQGERRRKERRSTERRVGDRRKGQRRELQRRRKERRGNFGAPKRPGLRDLLTPEERESVRRMMDRFFGPEGNASE